jgi:hypothetical protein
MMMLYNRKRSQLEIAKKAEILKQFSHANVVFKSMLNQVEDTIGKGVGQTDNIEYLVQRADDSFSTNRQDKKNSLAIAKLLKPKEQMDFLKALYNAKEDYSNSSLKLSDSAYQVYNLNSVSGSLGGYFEMLKKYTFKVTEAMTPGLGGAFNAIFRHKLAAGDYDFSKTEDEQSIQIYKQISSSEQLNTTYEPASNLNKMAHYNYCMQDKSLSNAYCELLEESNAPMFEELFLATEIN